jgi:hypothetical protein
VKPNIPPVIHDHPPTAVERLGREVFIEAPLYEAAEPYKPLYINETLFSWYFDDPNTDFDHMSRIIQSHFSTTLDITRSNGHPIGTAYVDRQADPLNISLNDNLGSGRAFYQDDIFNIKGEKTPLAQSPRTEYANGVLELEKSIFETIASNSLYGDVNIQLSPILAILDIHEPCRVSWKNTLCKRAKIIRVDMQGSLDRITHIFQAKRPMRRKELLETARKIGVQEGEKYLQRIHHGAWSAGNISAQANMIDFDTVSAVRYRAPQFSFTRWFLDNYFGLEWQGQLKILKSLATDTTINTERVPYRTLRQELVRTRQHYIERNFHRLMGFTRVHSRHQNALRRLVRKFQQLAPRCYPDPAALELKFLESQFCAPFNFSKFFRHYPLLRRCDDWDPYLGLEYLIDCVKAFPAFELDAVSSDDPDEAFFIQTVLKSLDRYFIHSNEELVACSAECLQFIQEYDQLFTRILADHPNQCGRIETRAYLVNEDRLHLLMPHSMAGPIDDNRDVLPYHRLHQVIRQTILSNRRSGQLRQGQLYASNMEIFQNGYFATLHNERHQHRLSLNFFDGCLTLLTRARYRIRVNGEFFPCQARQENEIVSLQSPLFDNLNLLEHRYGEIIFYYDDTPLAMESFMFSFTHHPQLENLASCINRP